MNEPNWTNRTMWTGDNLDIMRGMNSESVDLIYLDPPFNSNRTFAAPIGSKAAGAAFKDTWTLDDVDLAWHGEIADQHAALYAIISAAREAHGTGMQSYLIMMGVRLLEMRRLLKETGSIYLHCDPTAGHYLKLAMDAVFGAGNFRNEVVWRRTTSHSDAKGFGNVHDSLLFYNKGNDFQWNRVFQPLDEDYVERYYRYEDSNKRKFMSADLSAAGPGPERDFGDRGMIAPPSGRHWMYDDAGITKLLLNNGIYWTKNGVPRLKVYLDEHPGLPAQDVWDDILPLRSWHKERVGYPTQKPLALLDRIIRASSNEDDIVLDPFCGCATACVAADRLHRQWVGIDLSPLAAKLVRQRIQAEGPLLYDLIHRTDVPKRTDVGKLPSYKTHKHTLFGQQEGLCNGCRIFFPFQNFTVDHIVPQSKGGTHHIDNLQLLCNACNSKKGAGTQAELIVKLQQEGFIN